MSDTLFFKVTGGKILKAVREWQALSKAQNEARQALIREFDATGTYANEREVHGLVFKDDKGPEGWKRIQRDVYYPTGKTKAGRELRKKFKLPIPGALKFQGIVTGRENPFMFMEGMSCRMMGFETYGDIIILRVPLVAEKWTSPDEQCVEIKTSEYYKIKEQFEEAK